MIRFFLTGFLLIASSSADLIKLFEEIPDKRHNVVEYYSESEECTVLATYEY